MISCITTHKPLTPLLLLPLLEKDFSSWKDTQSPQVQAWIRQVGFTGKAGTSCLLPSQEGLPSQVAFGLSHMEDFWSYQAVSLSATTGTYVFPTSLQGKALEIATLGWILGQYRFETYTAKRSPPAILYMEQASWNCQVESLAMGVYLTRTLINTPAEHMGPTELAHAAKALAVRFEALYKETIGEDLLQECYPMVHAVGRASDDPPRVVELLWGKPTDPKVTLVGKGVCFDTGGLDLKPSDGMLLMKKDMGGAAHVLGLAHSLMATQTPIRLRVLIPMVENAVHGNAYRPGDVFPTRKGLFVEIGNTDAEGRLILADVLTEACADQPELLIDFATLTGAARIAVGTEISAFFTPNDALATSLMSYGQTCEDPLWRLPLHAPYRSLLDSNVADLNNAGGGGYGGAITAALFLQHFVEPSIPWVHFDIMAWNVRKSRGRAIGGEAMGLRAVFDYLQARYNTQVT
jgi:leucyl aminopeptidase